MRDPRETVPTLALTPPAIDGLAEALRGSHALSSPLLRRREHREWAEQSLRGVLSALPRTAVEPMVLALEGAHAQAVRTRPLFLSDGAWEDALLLTRYGQEVDAALGEEDGVLTVDGSDGLQQGQESVGVQRP